MAATPRACKVCRKFYIPVKEGKKMIPLTCGNKLCEKAYKLRQKRYQERLKKFEKAIKWENMKMNMKLDKAQVGSRAKDGRIVGTVIKKTSK